MKKLLALGMLSVWLLSGYTSGRLAEDLKVETASSSLFSEEEQKEAIDALKKIFIKDFDDCVLKSIAYAGDEFSKEQAAYYDHETAMKLYIDFQTGSFSSPALNENSEYPEYQILMYLDENGGWSIDYAGCGYG